MIYEILNIFIRSKIQLNCEFRVVVGSKIVVSPTIPSHNNTLVIPTHDLGSDFICWIVSYAILSLNQLVMRKTHSDLLCNQHHITWACF